MEPSKRKDSQQSGAKSEFTSTPKSKSARMTETPFREISLSPVASASQVGSDRNVPDNPCAPSSQTSSTNITETLLSVSLVNQNESSDDDSERSHPRKARKVPRAGRDWQNFKPREKNSIYNDVIIDQDHLNDHAYRWVNFLEHNEGQAMVFLMQFFVDVIGYQDYCIKKYGDVGEIITYMEANVPVIIKKHNTYLLKRESDWCENAQASIGRYIDAVLKTCANRGLLYERTMLTECLKFFKLMTLSRIRAIKHTGVFFAINFGVACAQILSNMMDHLLVCEETLLHSIEDKEKISRVTEDLDRRADELKEHLRFVQRILVKNYCFNDDELDGMRMLLARDLYKLIKALPYLHLVEFNCVYMLLNLLLDESKRVRASAVKTLKKLFKTEEYAAHLSARLQDKVLSQLGVTIYDVDYDVAALAISVFTCVIKTYPDFLSSRTTRNIFRMVYHKDYKIAAPAGEFLLTYLRDLSDEIVPTTVVVKLAQFHRTTGMLRLTPLLVESVIDGATELQTCDMVLGVLLRDEAEFDLELIILKILCHSVTQIITGKACLLRANHRRGDVNETRNDNIRCVLIPKLTALFERYGNEAQCQKNLMDMLLVLLTPTKLLAQFRGAFKKLFTILRALYFKSHDKEVLDKTITLYVQLGDTFSPLRHQAITEVDLIISKTISTYNNLVMDKPPEKYTQDEMSSLEMTYMRLVALYRHYDLSVNNFNLGTELPPLLRQYQKTHDSILCNSLECGEYTLVWELRKLIESSSSFTSSPDFPERMNRLKHRYEEFMGTCFNCLENCESKTVRAQAFWCICDLHQQYVTDMKVLMATMPVWEDLLFKLKDRPKEEQCFMNFMETEILDQSATDAFGCKYIAKFFNTVMLRKEDCFPHTMLCQVFSHYHRLYNKYKQQFNQVLNSFREVGVIAIGGFVVTILLYCYRRLQDRNNVTNDEFKDLRKLAVQFSLYLSQDNLFSVIIFSVKVAGTSENKLSYLRVVQSLLSPLNNSDRARVLEQVKTNLSKYKKNEHVIQFVERIKSKQTHTKVAERANSEQTNETMEAPTGSDVMELELMEGSE